MTRDEKPPEITVRASDLRSMLYAMHCDDDLVWCDTCGAWLALDDEARASTEDFTGCWKMATGGNPRYEHLCESQRGVMIEEIEMLLGKPALNMNDNRGKDRG